MPKAAKAAGLFLRGMIWIYRHTLSAFMGGQCRFMPSCSAYADEAIRCHGSLKGSTLAVKRICRCHPWGGHGFDPVPRGLGPAHLGKSGTSGSFGSQD